MQWHSRLCASAFCLVRVIDQNAVDDVVGSKAQQVTDAATSQALENEDVALRLQVLAMAEVMVGNLVALVNGDVVGCTYFLAS